ncbi:CCXG family PEP-CTERM protein [Thalassotalea euphylliae]|uniref:PEP-CTERM sorting domain-containing protein n=1 Tax=Thalassotalea euphylliae TaxID=1655234 RepID=A0A3E0U1X8_9GAMM|nr:CCXG family PEP-CTERM protein [Thalassotalea euphylliae]REL30573.1 hypothetical protein DXX94_07535 [Thalassotalea euphylliae]
MKASLSNMLLGLILCCCSVSLKTQAALITYETQGFTGNFSSLDLKTIWLNLDGDINSQSLDEFERVWSGNQTFSHLTIELNLAEDTIWTLQAGLDAGLGAQVYVDGISIFKDSTDLWWAYNWNHSDTVKIENLSLSQGLHQLEFYWLENCCNGFNSIRFTEQSSGITSVLNRAALSSFEIPNPVSVSLFGLALVGLFFTSFKRDYSH